MFKKIRSFLSTLFSMRYYRVETVVSAKIGNDWYYIGKRTDYKYVSWQTMEKWLKE